MELDGKDFTIGDKCYEGIPGIYELLFKAEPTRVIKKNVKNFRYSDLQSVEKGG